MGEDAGPQEDEPDQLQSNLFFFVTIEVLRSNSLRALCWTVDHTHRLRFLRRRCRGPSLIRRGRGGFKAEPDASCGEQST